MPSCIVIGSLSVSRPEFKGIKTRATAASAAAAASVSRPEFKGIKTGETAEFKVFNSPYHALNSKGLRR